MAQKLLDGSYACSICGAKYPNPVAADTCRDSHDIIYIPMTTTELNRLLNAIMINNTEIIPMSLINTIQKYARLRAILK